ncbi:MAG TPA: AI-2E family transporter [Candidatus Acidoferrales bacterium]|nr:AI-2E family transporter [Candidatus Acidoferrales bacterium]
MAGKNPWSWLTEERLTYALKLLLVIVIVLYLTGVVLGFLERIGGLLYVVVGAVFLAYLLYPAVRRLRARMPLGAALAIVYAVLVLVVAVAVYLIVPRVTEDIRAAAQNIPKFVAAYMLYVNDPSDPVISRLPATVRIELLHLPVVIVGWLREHGIEAASHALTILLGAFTVIATFVIIPVLSIYLLADMDRLRASFLQLVPRDRWKTALAVLEEIDGVIGGFIRGQLIVAATVGILLTVGLLILHVPYAFLLGALAGAGDLVPYVGAVLTFIPAVGTALLSNGWVDATAVAAIFVGIYQLEGHVIAPMIVSSRVKLSPLIVLLAVLIGAELGGIFGMVVAIPVAGVLRVILMHLSNQEAG